MCLPHLPKKGLKMTTNEFKNSSDDEIEQCQFALDYFSQRIIVSMQSFDWNDALENTKRLKRVLNKIEKMAKKYDE